MKPRAPTDTLWICGRVLADRRAPFGTCGQPVDNALGRVAIDRALRRRVAHRLPTLARLSPTTPQLGNKFFLL